MHPSLASVRDDLEALYRRLQQGQIDLAAAQRELAVLRVTLLRLRRRSIALLLSTGVTSLPRMEQAVAGAIGAVAARARLSAA